jgi:phosphotriesterase-related protein
MVELRVETIAKLCERGHAAKLILSHDTACFNDCLPEHTLPAMPPNWHYLRIHRDVSPALRVCGVTDEMSNTMLVDNPRKIFAAQGAYRNKQGEEDRNVANDCHRQFAALR